MLADGGAGELDAVAVAVDADEGEVAGASADVADENELAVEELFLRLRKMVGDPGIEGGGGFFDEGEGFDAGVAGGLDGELAGFFVEGGGDGDDDVLGGEGMIGVGLIPGVGRCGRGFARRLRRARERGRLPGRPREGSWRCDRPRDWRASFWRSGRTWWGRARLVRGHMRRDTFDRRGRGRRGGCGAARSGRGRWY